MIAPSHCPFPDQVSHILNELENRKQGRGLPDVWLEFALDRQHCPELMQALEERDLIHKIRYDYFFSTQTFVLRMASRPHEHVVEEVREDWFTEVKGVVRKGGPAADLAAKIMKGGSTSTSCNELKGMEYGRHSPDISFYYDKEVESPRVVVEISYTQNKKELKNLAHEYLVGSDGKVTAMVGIDIGNTYHEASFEIWRADLTMQTNGKPKQIARRTFYNQFRDEHGLHANNPDTHFQLELSDFVGPTEYNIPIRLSSAALCAYIDTAKSLAEVIANLQPSPVRSGLDAGTPPHTPLEQLSPGREGQFQADEDEDEKREEMEDGWYEDEGEDEDDEG
ncbi:hypothetical protein MMC30_007163 [Trapelia coarctata]|nr:hypothetical protein [Trapelia coarctata]